MKLRLNSKQMNIQSGIVLLSCLFLTCTSGDGRQFPTFTHEKTILHYSDLSYNPRDDIIFPSVIKAYKYFDDPLGKYYLYYAPHSKPGGICLAYAENLNGPWHEYRKNPLVKNKWDPHYEVSHVSSPHVIWNKEETKLFLYFHGENTTTRLASSRNGIDFKYEDEVIRTKRFNDISEASYARIFRYKIPEKQNKYIMMLMGNNNGTRRIYLAWSDDGRNWDTRREPFINPPPGTGANQVCAAWYFSYNGNQYIVFHGDKMQESLSDILTNLYIVETGRNFKSVEHLGKFYDRHQITCENERVSDPCLIRENGNWYLFSSAGPRLHQYLVLAKTSSESTK